jgi:hypothetical protein
VRRRTFCLGLVDGRSRAFFVPLCWLNPASERLAQPSSTNVKHVFVRKPVYLLIYSLRPFDRRKVISFVPLLIFIATKGPSETTGPFSGVLRRRAGSGDKQLRNQVWTWLTLTIR